MTTTQPEAALGEATNKQPDPGLPPGGYTDEYRNILEQWAKQFYRDTYGLVPIYTTEGKGPKYVGWQHLCGTDEHLDPYKCLAVGIGLLLGNDGNRLADVDLDHDLAHYYAPRFLTPTSWIFGRPGKPHAHWMYRVRPGTEHEGCIKFNAPKPEGGDGKPVCVVEYRYSKDGGLQTVVPPSWHEETGSPREWHGGPPKSPPSEIDGKELYVRVQGLFMACMLHDVWTDGQKYEVSISAHTALLQAGVDPQLVVWFFKALDAGGTTDWDYQIRRTQERLASGEKCEGMRTLVEKHKLARAKAERFVGTLAPRRSGPSQGLHYPSREELGSAVAAADEALTELRENLKTRGISAVTDLTLDAPRRDVLVSAIRLNRVGWNAILAEVKDRDTKRLLKVFEKDVEGATANVENTPEPPDPSRAVIEKIGKRFAYATVGGKPGYIDTEEETTLSIWTKQALTEYYEQDGWHEGKKWINPASVWTRSDLRKRYEGLRMMPDPSKCDPRYYNLFRGFQVARDTQPNPEQRCSRWLAHVHENICNSVDNHYWWLLAWFALLVQDPSAVHGVAVVLQGGKGTGKGITALPFYRYIFHRSNAYRADQSSQLLGRFNAHLATACFVFADESFWAGSKAEEGVLKGLITENRGGAEFKGRDAVQIDRHISMLISSNEEWVIPATIDDRRFTVFRVSKAHQQDKAYFAAVVQEMKNGGNEALLGYLLGLDLKTLPDPRTPLQTDALTQQVVEGLAAEFVWWKGLLDEGVLPVGSGRDRSEGEWAEQPSSVISSAMVESYADFLKVSGNRVRPKNKNPRNVLAVVKECCPSLSPTKTRGVRGWSVPRLSTARSEFDQWLRSK